MLNSLDHHSPGNFYGSRESSRPWDLKYPGTALAGVGHGGCAPAARPCPGGVGSSRHRGFPAPHREGAEGRGGEDRQQSGGGVTGQVTRPGDRMRSRLSVTQRAHSSPAVPPENAGMKQEAEGGEKLPGEGPSPVRSPMGSPDPAAAGVSVPPPRRVRMGSRGSRGCPWLMPVPLAGGTRAGSPGTWRRSGCSSAITWEPS